MKNSRQQAAIWGSFTVGSTALMVMSWKQILPMTLSEVFAFASGVLCVWLTVKENIWNWPIGIINSAFFAWLFFTSRLFADMSLQVLYIILGVLGWYLWLKGGEGKTALPISKTSIPTWATLAGATIAGTWLATRYLVSIRDAAPFADALTTVMSLVAQYLLTKKKIENWYVWISVDVIYIGLYAYKHLYLTSVLYLIFLLMCVAGYRHWKKLSAPAMPSTPLPMGGIAHA